MPRIHVFIAIFSACVALGMSSMARGGIYTHRFLSMDGEQGIDACNSFIQQAAARFQQDSGVNLLGAECQNDSLLGRYRGEITYSAGERVAVWSTTGTNYGEEFDFFNSRALCEESLARELEVMENSTGLSPFVAFCHKTSEIGPPRYRTRIDAVGTAAVRRFESAATFYHQLQVAPGELDPLQDQARALGLTPVAWHLGNVRTLHGLSVAYYAQLGVEGRYYLHGKPSLYVPTLEECRTAQAVFEQTRTTGWTGVSACSAAHPSVGFQFNAIWWDTAVGADFTMRATAIPGSYASLPLCHDAARSLAPQLDRDGEKVVGIVCGRDSNSRSPFKMEVLSLYR